jgi:hypothetical protein
MTHEELVGRLTELDKRATPGPWLNGAWSGRCHKDHRHRGPQEPDPCCYEYTLGHEDEKDREVSLENYCTLISDKDIRLDDARLIAEVRTLLPDIIAALRGI